MTAQWNLVTGATGLLGSHLVERLVERGERVRALVRPASDVRELERWPVELVRGDLSDARSLQGAVANVGVVYHCAARLGDWGPWPMFEAGTVQTTRNLVEVCLGRGVRRFLHVSSVAAYGRPRRPADGSLLDECAPLGQNFRWWDYYGRAKAAAEEEVRRLGPAATIVRPTWIYGPRDRVILPRMVQALRQGRVVLIGSGDNRLNMVYAGDVAEGAVLAANSPAAAGEVFHLASEGEITQQQFFDSLADSLGLPRVKRRVPFRVADTFGLACEMAGRATGRKRAPAVTRSGISLLSRATLFSSEKARRLLGWQPRMEIHEGLSKTLAWLAQQEA
ncbi:MAG: NAD-dependent epimerase/dehydratase family protein [Pirellulaceae bacterium]|nr:NAD-dependent epimerase/dehydratase family protein [Pirellulaceae bacterium]